MLVIRNEAGEILGKLISFSVTVKGEPIYEIGMHDGTKKQFAECYGDVTLKHELKCSSVKFN